MTLRIGVHPNNLHLSLAHLWPELFVALDVEWVPYAEGRASAQWLADGRIDLCGTGSTPPILAQAAGAAVRYVAASAPRPANGGLLVAPGSRIRAVSDLAGARVALLDGSFHTFLLARELERAGLALPDVIRVELSPGASQLALAAGEVDAWVAMAPMLGAAMSAGRARLLAACGDTIPNRSMFWTLHDRRIPGPVLDAATRALTALGRAIAVDPGRAAASLAGGDPGTDAAVWRDVVAGRDWSVVPAGPEIGAEQQAEADTLQRHGVLPGPVDIRTALLLSEAAA